MDRQDDGLDASSVPPSPHGMDLGEMDSTDASPDPIILRLSIIIIKLPNVRDQPIETASNGVTLA